MGEGRKEKEKDWGQKRGEESGESRVDRGEGGGGRWNDKFVGRSPAATRDSAWGLSSSLNCRIVGQERGHGVV